MTPSRRVRAGLATRLALALALAALPATAHAQLSANNLLLGQAGNTLYTTPRDRVDVYDRLDLAYRGDGFSAGVRFEHDRSSDDREFYGRAAAYDRITQRWAEWDDGHARVRVGNFYTLLGRGLLHRSFELPGVVYDESGSRSRFAAARDLDGVLAQGEAGIVRALAFSGRANDATVSPASEALGAQRYRGVLSGAQIAARLPRGSQLGTAWTRFDYGDAPSTQHASLFAGTDLLALTGTRAVALPVYVEYAQQDASTRGLLQMRRGHEVPHAFYSSAQALWGAYSLSAEYKDYDGFRLGINDPPSLVREHTATLLNRDTHLLDADGEAGFQLEASAPACAWVTLTANLSRSDGAPGIRLLRFEERYLEAHIAPTGEPRYEATLFADRGFDTFDFIGDRHAIGALTQARLVRGFALALDVERKRAATRPFRGPSERHEDRFVQVTLSRAGWGSVAFAATRTTDPIDLPTDDFGEPTRSHAWFSGMNATAELGRMHTVSLFVGKRRGGRACTSGTCYDVPSLDGAELRWTSRL